MVPITGASRLGLPGRLGLSVFAGGYALMTRLTRSAADGAVILNYHSVGDSAKQGVFPGNCVATSLFERQMRFLRDHCTPVTLDDLEPMLAGSSALPRRAVAVTFDDGYRGVAEEALPILKACGIVATVFLPTDWISTSAEKWEDRLSAAILNTTEPSLRVDVPSEGERDFVVSDPAGRLRLLRALCLPISRRPAAEIEERVDAIVAACRSPATPRSLLAPVEVRELSRGGAVRFGSHSAGHHRLVTLDEPVLRDDLRRSRDLVAHWTEKPCTHFAFPFGGADDIGPRPAAVLRELGYTMALTTIEGVARPGDDMFMLRRVLAHPDDPLSIFELKVLGRFDDYSRKRDAIRSRLRG